MHFLRPNEKLCLLAGPCYINFSKPDSYLCHDINITPPVLLSLFPAGFKTWKVGTPTKMQPLVHFQSPEEQGVLALLLASSCYNGLPKLHSHLGHSTSITWNVLFALLWAAFNPGRDCWSTNPPGFVPHFSSRRLIGDSDMEADGLT